MKAKFVGSRWLASEVVGGARRGGTDVPESECGIHITEPAESSPRLAGANTLADSFRDVIDPHVHPRFFQASQQTNRLQVNDKSS